MTGIAKLRVHIAPVGYEIDRVILPAKQEKADKVWLLIHENKSEDKAVPFISEITDRLEKLGIDTIQESHNRLNLFQIIGAVKSIIDKEKENDIYVNLASGSKIQAIAMMMACMMFNDNLNIYPFYVEAKDYPGFKSKKPLSTGIKEIQSIPTYSIKIPDAKLIGALRIINENDGKITKKKMATLAEEKELITVNTQDQENHSMIRFTSLEKNIIGPLVEWGFVKIEKIGRNRWIKITQEGQNASEFLV